jgi:hypothetical protein
LDLYYRSNVHMRQNKTSEQYEFEKNAEELTFNPQIKRGPVNKKRRIEQRVQEIEQEKMEKLQGLAQERQSQFKTSSKVADGVNYRVPVGGAEGSKVPNKYGRKLSESPVRRYNPQPTNLAEMPDQDVNQY